MSQIEELPPSAASLSESMRDIGYSLETAVADIIDNSISAGATKVEIRCHLGQERPVVAILDNGSGMTSHQLIAAMRHGVRNPREVRSATDLGRFGLGLKTASFSQCRSLTVVTSLDGKRSGAEWDLDRIAKEDGWFIAILDPAELDTVPDVQDLPASGTLVVWQKLDRLFEDQQGLSREEIVNEKLDLVRSHLSLVFHRFLSGEVGPGKLSILVNGHPLTPFDPFCTANKATQKLPKDVVKVNGHKVEIQAYILPHHSRLSAREYDFYRTRSDFISNQGAYIYRNGRLMTWGDWFRLIPKGEATKLGRVQIDFTNALDEEWTIDIKKSRAKPPRVVRDHLRQILPRITSTAVRVHRGRGQRLIEGIEEPLWERYADQDRIRYALNNDHPLIEALSEGLDEGGRRKLRTLIEAIASALPIEMMYSDYSANPRDFSTEKLTDEEALARLRELKLVLYPDSAFNPNEFRKVILSTRAFEDCFETVERFLSEGGE